MTLALDLDGVLGDIRTAYFGWHNNAFGTSFVASKIDDYDLYVAVGETRPQTVAKLARFYGTKNFRDIVPIPGAQEGVASLAKKHELMVVTGRPHDQEEPTRAWLGKHFPGAFMDVRMANHFATNGREIPKSQICRDVGARLLIDDHLEYSLECGMSSIPSVLVDWRYNRSKMTDAQLRTFGVYRAAWPAVPSTVDLILSRTSGSLTASRTLSTRLR